MFYKSLCFSTLLLMSSFTHADACNESEALKIGLSVIKEQFHDYEKSQPYKVEGSDNIWHIFGTLPEGVIGGTPEVKIKKQDCKVTRVYHTQ